METIIYKELSHKVLSMAFSVHNILGPGLLESAYEGAYCVELARAGISFERQRVFPLHYKGELVGAYIADIAVDNTIILELKSVSALNQVMEAQLINYLRLSKLPVGRTRSAHPCESCDTSASMPSAISSYNGVRVEWKRFVFEKGS